MIGDDVYFTSKKPKNKSPRVFSLYFGLVGAIIMGAFLSLLIYVATRAGAEYYISTLYMSEASQKARRDEYLISVSEFIMENGITAENISRLEEWTKENKYVFLSVYDGESLEPIFSSIADDPTDPNAPTDSEDPENPGDPTDPENPGEPTDPENPIDPEDPNAPIDPDNPEDGESGEEDNTGSGIGGIISRPTKDELLEQMAAITDHKIITVTKDGESYSLMVKIYEYGEYLYRDIFNVISYVLAMIVLAAVIVEHFGRIIARIKRLQYDVNEVAAGRLDHTIIATGFDEITKLSYDVDDMRLTMLDNIEKERNALEMNTELITSMSHDIRTPLTVLMGYVDIMKTDLSPEEMKEYVLASEKTVHRLKQLSDDMFKYFRAFGKGAEGITMEEYDATTLFDQLLSEHVLLLMEAGYKVEYNIDELMNDKKIVRTDAPHLMRIVDNIFSNLYKYADMESEVYITGKKVDDLAVFEFKNTVKINSGAESSKVGLKTCKRLSEYILNDFEWSEEDGIFTLTMSLKLYDEGTKISESFYI